MKLRNPWLIRFAAFLASVVIRLWMGTLRYRILCLGDEEHPADFRRRRFIYSFWHESILFPTAIRTRIHALISHHADGELITQVCRHLRFGVVRGSTTRGGTKALLQLIECSKKSHLLVTPDGPRGPRRKLQPGIIYLASQTGLPIIPCGIAYGKAWRAKSWDRFALPCPWTAAYGVAGEAIHIPAGLDRKRLEYYRQLVEQHMLEATATAERWAEGKGKPARREKGSESTERRSA